MPKNILGNLLRFFFLIGFITLTSCEHTKSLWENSYKDKIGQFLVSQDGRFVALGSEKYHYIFDDKSGILKELLELDKDLIVFLSTESTHLKLDEKNYISGHIGFETFDLQLTPEQNTLLHKLKFEKSKKDETLALEIEVRGKRFLAQSDFNQYFSLLNEKYEIEIRRPSSIFNKVEEVALTPLTLTEDLLVLFEEIALTPFKE